MKNRVNTLRAPLEIGLLVILALVLAIGIRVLIINGLEPASQATQEYPTQAYPPPEEIVQITDLSTEVPYPGPTQYTTPVTITLVHTPPAITITPFEEWPPTLTPWPSPTPYPSATLRPGPTNTPVPLVQPASDASGMILYLDGADNKNTTLDALSMDGKGLVIGSNLKSSTGTNLSWGNAYASPDGSRIALFGEWCAEGILFTDSGKYEPLYKYTIGPCGRFFDWHPDNHHILILSTMNYEGLGLWLVDTDTWEFTVLAAPGIGKIRGGSISPDGRKVIYSWEGAGSGEVWMVNTDGQDAYMLSSENGAPSNFAWSPDGSKIVFPGPYGITLIDEDGENLRTLKSASEAGCGIRHYPPIWSPDSRFLLIQNDLDDLPYTDPWSPQTFKDAGICLVDVVNDITSWLPPGETTGNMHPTWSPDGSQVAFVSDRSGMSEIWAINVDGANLRQLTSIGRMVRFPFWKR
jgi:WD40-like Beta Propeller Repeat